jgi:hypothetical protein
MKRVYLVTVKIGEDVVACMPCEADDEEAAEQRVKKHTADRLGGDLSRFTTSVMWAGLSIIRDERTGEADG